MLYAIDDLAKTLKAARQRRQLSQRALSRFVGLPQAQISKIENAAVDLRASTLVALARALEMDVILVPRQHLPAVNSIIASGRRPADATPPRPAYTLDPDDDDDDD